MLDHDIFAEEYRFKLPGGKDAHASCYGCLLTIFLVFFCLSYAAMQSIKLLTFDETDVMLSSRDSYFDTTYEYSEGLAVAFGITKYDNITESIEDPSYGVLNPYYKTWGFGD